jgi:hypothetical protein
LPEHVQPSLCSFSSVAVFWYMQWFCFLLINMYFSFFQKVVTGGGEHAEDTVIGPDPANQEVASFLIC